MLLAKKILENYFGIKLFTTQNNRSYHPKIVCLVSVFLWWNSCATDCSSGWLEGPNKVYIPFLACGDLSGYDSDRSYPLPKSAEGTYQILDPVQPPIAPPYKRALEMKKASSQGIRDFDKLSLDPWRYYFISILLSYMAWLWFEIMDCWISVFTSENMGCRDPHGGNYPLIIPVVPFIIWFYAACKDDSLAGVYLSNDAPLRRLSFLS